MAVLRERVPGEGLVAGRGPHFLDGEAADSAPRIGVLALQGDVLEHLRILGEAGAHALPVKRAEQLDELDGLLIPGGESTTIGRLASLYGLLEPLRERIASGLPAFGTCAGAILLGREALGADGRPSAQPLLGCMDTVVRRNAFGGQVDSFEADLDVDGVEGGQMHAVFIRAPWIESAGAAVRPLATVTPVSREGRTLDARVVVARQGHMLASAFHPELTGDPRLHHLFLRMVSERVAAS
jgi:pyridoxal 5'-phosphate synthase pdxT subunit